MCDYCTDWLSSVLYDRNSTFVRKYYCNDLREAYWRLRRKANKGPYESTRKGMTEWDSWDALPSGQTRLSFSGYFLYLKSEDRLGHIERIRPGED